MKNSLQNVKFLFEIMLTLYTLNRKPTLLDYIKRNKIGTSVSEVFFHSNLAYDSPLPPEVKHEGPISLWL